MIWIYDAMPRSSTRATRNISPDGSNATILDKGNSKWLSGRIQRHDPRQGPLQIALRMDPMPRSSTGATQNGSPFGSNSTILDRGHSKLLPGWIQCHAPRNCRQTMARRMDPMPRSSTGATQNGSPDRIQRHDPQSLERNSARGQRKGNVRAA